MPYSVDIIHATDHVLAPLIPILKDTEEKKAILIDPGVDELILNNLDSLELTPTDILITHYHPDHVGGIAGIVKKYPDIRVMGPTRYENRIPHLKYPLSEGIACEINGLDIRVINTAAHTLDHLAFWIPQLDVVFVGDTVFPFSVGRLFEGSPALLWTALQKLRMLPLSTQIYFGHDIMMENAAFTLSIEPDNLAAQEAQKLLKSNPSMVINATTVAKEKQYNLFWRADEPLVAELLGSPDSSAIDVVAILRGLRDEFSLTSWPNEPDPKKA